LGSELSDLAEKPGKVTIEGDFNLRQVAVGLAGERCEPVERVRGEALLVPLRWMGAGFWAWLGYREEWDLNEEGRPTPARRRFTFRSAGLTVHLGRRGDRLKPQLFRAEWAGWTTWPGIGLGFQAEGAGHPHWQFDALDSLGTEADAELAKEYLKVLRAEEQHEVEPQDFVPQGLTADDVRALVRQRPLSRMHFPSGAHWWRDAPANTHAHAPQSTDELRRWVALSVGYICRELDRLAVT
jgi:hypothetical protein